MDSIGTFKRDLEKQGFSRYSINDSAEVVMNLSNPYGKQLNMHMNQTYDATESDIANFLFAAISNTDSDKIFFSYQSMFDFIISHSYDDCKNFKKDTEFVLSDLESLNILNTTSPIIFNEAKLNPDDEVITLILSPAAKFIFGTANFGGRKLF